MAIFEPDQIVLIDAMNYATVNDPEKLFPLGIRSAKAAIFINKVLNWKKCNCSISARSYYKNPAVKGGGLFIAGRAIVALDEMANVFIYFNAPYQVNNMCRNAVDSCGIPEDRSTRKNQNLVKDIKDKLANLIKSYWKDDMYGSELATSQIGKVFAKTGRVEDGKFVYLKTKPSGGYDANSDYKDDELKIDVSYSDYRAIYEHLKGRDKDRNIKRNGKESYDNMIGNPIEDQFIINAVDLMRNEMDKLKKEYDQNIYDVDKAFDEEMRNIRRHAENQKNELKSQYVAAAKKIKDEMIKIINMGMITGNQYKFSFTF